MAGINLVFSSAPRCRIPLSEGPGSPWAAFYSATNELTSGYTHQVIRLLTIKAMDNNTAASPFTENLTWWRKLIWGPRVISASALIYQSASVLFLFQRYILQQTFWSAWPLIHGSSTPREKKNGFDAGKTISFIKPMQDGVLIIKCEWLSWSTTVIQVSFNTF